MIITTQTVRDGVQEASARLGTLNEVLPQITLPPPTDPGFATLAKYAAFRDRVLGEIQERGQILAISDALLGGLLVGFADGSVLLAQP